MKKSQLNHLYLSYSNKFQNNTATLTDSGKVQTHILSLIQKNEV